jgi:hypothetical protein
MRRLSTALAIAAAMGLVPQEPSRAQAEEALSLVKQAAKVYARDVRGVIGFRAVTDSQISAPMLNQTIRSEALMVLKDGIPVKIVMERLVTNGKEASREQVQKQEAQTNATFKEGKGFFKAPYDARYLESYRFELEDCADCAPGSTAIRFSSTVKDDQHGKGVMILDEAKRIREVRYTPNAYPPNVTQGKLALKRDEVGKGMFGIRTLSVDYQGAMGPLKGSFVMEQRNEGFRRYASLEEALAQAESQASKP